MSQNVLQKDCKTEKIATPTTQECSSNDQTTICLMTEATNCEAIPPYLATDFIEGIELQKIIKTIEVIEPSDRLMEEWKNQIDIQKVWQTVLTGLRHYSTKHINGQIWAHRDIKPENILVYKATDGTLKYKIIDFGVATHFLEKNDEGSPVYKHPKAKEIDGNNAIHDIYGSLVTLVEIVYRQNIKDDLPATINQLSILLIFLIAMGLKYTRCLCGVQFYFNCKHEQSEHTHVIYFVLFCFSFE